MPTTSCFSCSERVSVLLGSKRLEKRKELLVLVKLLKLLSEMLDLLILECKLMRERVHLILQRSARALLQRHNLTNVSAACA